MPQLLLAMLTNYCNQTSRRKMQNIEGDRKDTLSAKNAMYMNTLIIQTSIHQLQWFEMLLFSIIYSF